jgi:hypothetical protein
VKEKIGVGFRGLFFFVSFFWRSKRKKRTFKREIFLFFNNILFSFSLMKKKQKIKKRSSAHARAGKPPLPFLACAPKEFNAVLSILLTIQFVYN